MSKKNILEKIIENKKIEIAILKKKKIEFKIPEKEKFKFRKIFENGNLKIIAEFKKASPSKGEINKNAKLSEYIMLFDKYADAISILTDEKFFYGNINFVKEAKEFTKLPILAKDFYLHPLQIRRALNFGADAILIIAKILQKKDIKILFEECNQLGIDAIFEAHSKEDLEKIFESVEPKIIGINTRDLNDFSIHQDIIDKLLNFIPKNVYIIAESGIKEPMEIKNLKNKVNGVLIGTAIMSSKHPEEFLKSLKSYV